MRRALAALVLIGCNSGGVVDGGTDAACRMTLEEIGDAACSVEGQECTYDCVPSPCGGYEMVGPLYATCMDGSWSSRANWDVFYEGIFLDSRCTIERSLDGGRSSPCHVNDSGPAPDAAGD